MAYDVARASVRRLLECGTDLESEIELVAAAASLDGMSGGEFRLSRGTDLTPPGRVGVGVGWTVALPSGRHHGAYREVVAAVRADMPTARRDAIRQVLVDAAEGEVLEELRGLKKWQGGSMEHLDAAEFYERFLEDVAVAQSSVFMIAPFLGRRLATLVQPLSDACARGVSVTAMVRRRWLGKAWAADDVAAARSAGVRFVEVPDTKHEKLVIVDREIAYLGSANTLSHNGQPSEIMVRHECPPIAESLHVLYHPDAGQTFGERRVVDVADGGQIEERIAWGDPPDSWKAGRP